MHAIIIFLKLLIKASKSYFKFRVIVQHWAGPKWVFGDSSGIQHHVAMIVSVSITVSGLHEVSELLLCCNHLVNLGYEQYYKDLAWRLVINDSCCKELWWQHHI